MSKEASSFSTIRNIFVNASIDGASKIVLWWNCYYERVRACFSVSRLVAISSISSTAHTSFYLLQRRQQMDRGVISASTAKISRRVALKARATNSTHDDVCVPLARTISENYGGDCRLPGRVGGAGALSYGRRHDGTPSSSGGRGARRYDPQHVPTSRTTSIDIARAL